MLLLCLIVIVIVGLASTGIWALARGRATASKAASPSSPSAVDAASTSSASANSASASAMPARLSGLREALTTQIAGYPGTWSVAVLDVDSGTLVQVGDTAPMVSASLIKLSVMVAVFQKIQDGALQESPQIDTLLREMITVSSNDATNELVKMLGNGSESAGMDTVNRVATDEGFSATKQLRPLNDAGTATGGAENWTSTRDCATLLARAYQRQLVSADASGKMLSLLDAQTRRSKLPAGLPAGVRIGNKTGELPGVENDAGIVYAPHPYAIAVMTAGVDSASAQKQIAAVSAAVYRTVG